MNKWIRCLKCNGWFLPKSQCRRCNKTSETIMVDESQPARVERDVLRLNEVSRTLSSVKPTTIIQCSVCEVEFDPEEPRHKNIGKYDACAECATDVVKLTGVMIHGSKTANEIQINRNPKLTEYMLGAGMRGSSASSITKEGGQVVKTVTGLENRRHGESK